MKWLTKKVIAILAACVLVIGAIITTVVVTAVPRERTLKILSWEDYGMPKSMRNEFRDYMKTATGKRWKVSYHTKDDNEAMYTALTTQKKNYDLVVVSEYMVEKMYKENMLQKIDLAKIENGYNEDFDYTEEFDEDIYKHLVQYTENGEDPNTYAIPYMYGTLGIMYNTKLKNGTSTGVDPETLYDEGWEALWNTDYAISMKQTARDSYSAAILYANRAALLDRLQDPNSYEVGDKHADFIQQIFSTADEDSVETAEIALTAQRNTMKTAGKPVMYETDLGKNQMINGSNQPVVSFEWSCNASYAMMENHNIGYFVPEEGSNLWIDAFVIPKNAKNAEGAHEFLNFVCGKEQMIENMEEAGGCSAHIAARTAYEEQLWEEYDDEDEDWTQMLIDTIIPTLEVTAKCGIMRYFSDESNGKKFDIIIDEMWMKVRNS